jgi:hypothetical protein
MGKGRRVLRDRRRQANQEDRGSGGRGFINLGVREPCGMGVDSSRSLKASGGQER